MPSLADTSREAVTVNAARNEVLHLIYKGKDKIINSGLAKGDALSAQRTAAKVTHVAGFYGEPYYYESGDDSAKVTINLKDGSEADSIFQALYNDQFDDENNLVQTFDLKIEQTDKHKVTTLTDCLIDNQPKQDMNDADHSMAWTLIAGKMTTIAKKPNDPDIPWDDGTSANGGGTLPGGDTPSKVTINVHYQDQDGKAISELSDTSVIGNSGDSYTIPTPMVTGYTYTKTTVPLSGKLLTNQSAVVTYTKNGSNSTSASQSTSVSNSGK